MRNLFFAATLFLFMLNNAAMATHIIGGELEYKCLYFDKVTNQAFYSFTLTLYRDCSYGTAAFDSTVKLAVYDGNENFVKTISISLPPTDTLHNNYYPCYSGPTGICIEKAGYSGSTMLSPGYYYLTYQRCCLNNNIINIVNPMDVGLALHIEILVDSIIKENNTPYFDVQPPDFVCFNKNINYDASATDTDGDSLIYRLCPAYTFSNVTIPDPPLPPSEEFIVPYQTGYTYLFPFGSSDTVIINPQTGLMAFTPTQIGKYILAVCADEFRDGYLLSTVKREMQFVIAPCIKKQFAGFTYTDSALMVYFNDTTATLAQPAYTWDFGDGTFSSDNNPVHQYASSGTYDVCLIVTDTLSQCVDTFCNKITVSGLGMDDNNFPNHFNRVFPNPVNKSASIEFGYPHEDIDVVLFNSLGMVLQKHIIESEKKSFSLDMTDLNEGIYCLKITDKKYLPLERKIILLQ